ncbi:MAG: PqqD family protein, partial [Actinomycetota bacterium]
VALDVARSSYIGINKTGAVLWPLLAKGADEDERVAAVVAKFDIDEPTARADIASFIDGLMQRELLEKST